MQFTREITHLMALFLLALFGIVAAAAYWAVLGSDSLLVRDDNPRLFLDEARISRGTIYDRDERVLVQTNRNEDGTLQRDYLHDAMHSALGYASLRYGVGGAEAAYDAALSGDLFSEELPARFERDVLHLPQRGADIQLTLDLALQIAIAGENIFADHRGAIVIMAVPEGEILALISQPTYDPNVLDTTWDELIAAPGEPFFNRVLQGQYQPGGMLQTPLIIAATLTRQDTNRVFDNATDPITVNDLTLTCIEQAPDEALTLSQAYAYGCPQPFATLIETIEPSTLDNIIMALRLGNAPLVPGFNPDVLTPTDATPTPLPQATTHREDLLGQGELTINPLGMAQLMAAILNDGNAPQPYMLDAIRPPDTTEWTPVTSPQTTIPLMTATAAEQVRSMMVQNVSRGISSPATQADLTIGGHTALAFSGNATQAWFTGFIEFDATSGAAIALVLEDSADTALVAQIGGEALKAAYDYVHNAPDS